MGFYGNKIAPRLISCACGVGKIMEERVQIIAQAEGRVLEIGLGSGHNLPLYDSAKVTHLWGLEPNPGMRRLAKRKVQDLSVPFEFLDLPGEEVPLDDNSADTVVSTFTFCSIPELDKAMAQIRRVLKPGGSLLMLEHGAAPDPRVARWQQRIEPFWKRIGDGCHLTRNMTNEARSAGFTLGEIDERFMPAFDRPELPAFTKAAAYLYSGRLQVA